MTNLLAQRIKSHIRAWNMQDFLVKGDETLEGYSKALDDIMFIIEREEGLDILHRGQYKGSVVSDE